MYDQSAYWQAQLMNWGPKIVIAILILVATWVVARAVKWVLQKAIDRYPALKKHVTGTPEETVGHQLGTIAKLIIWLVGIMAAVNFLGWTFTSVGFTGTKTFTLKLVAGKYKAYCAPHESIMFQHFTVT